MKPACDLIEKIELHMVKGLRELCVEQEINSSLSKRRLPRLELL